MSLQHYQGVREVIHLILDGVKMRGWKRAAVTTLILGLLGGSPSPALADEQGQSSHPDEEFSRISAFATDHTLSKGDWLLGYAYMYMDMPGQQDGTNKLSKSEFFSDFSFPVQPLWMTMEMHMFHVMYAFTDKLTFMTMIPFVQNEMKHELGPMTMMPGVTFKTQSVGLGDVEILAHYTAYDKDWNRIIPRVGLRIPTGSIDETDSTPMGEVRLPYPMQLGSGTWDFEIGATAIAETASHNNIPECLYLRS